MSVEWGKLARRLLGSTPGASRRGLGSTPGASRWGLGLCLAGLACCLPGPATYCRPDPVTGSQQCQYSTNSAGNALLVTGAAAGVYAATGCTVNGCELPNRCNSQTKRCEPITCRENTACPAGYRCDLVTMICR